MIDEAQIQDDFINRGMSPFQLHVKYECSILYIYEVLKQIPRVEPTVDGVYGEPLYDSPKK